MEAFSLSKLVHTLTPLVGARRWNFTARRDGLIGSGY